jgi:hypothetical protein
MALAVEGSERRHAAVLLSLCTAYSLLQEHISECLSVGQVYNWYRSESTSATLVGGSPGMYYHIYCRMYYFCNPCGWEPKHCCHADVVESADAKVAGTLFGNRDSRAIGQEWQKEKCICCHLEEEDQ